jgi:uncharacterized protein YndB with AHSA1/START domain
MTDPTNAPATDPQILITRIFDAPRESVFAAWTDPEQVAEWYGPEHFDTPREKITIEPRIGGRWDVTMVQRESGKEFPAKYEIIELVEPELIVLRCEPMPEFGIPDAVVTRVELHDHGEKTRMTLSDGPYAAEMESNAEAGWNGALDKLAVLLGG